MKRGWPAIVIVVAAAIPWMMKVAPPWQMAVFLFFAIVAALALKDANRRGR